MMRWSYELNLHEHSAAQYDIGNERSMVAAGLPFYLTTIAPEGRVLEIGCGTGRVSLPLAVMRCQAVNWYFAAPRRCCNAMGKLL